MSITTLDLTVGTVEEAWRERDERMALVAIEQAWPTEDLGDIDPEVFGDMRDVVGLASDDDLSVSIFRDPETLVRRAADLWLERQLDRIPAQITGTVHVGIAATRKDPA